MLKDMNISEEELVSEILDLEDDREYASELSAAEATQIAKNIALDYAKKNGIDEKDVACEVTGDGCQHDQWLFRVKLGNIETVLSLRSESAEIGVAGYKGACELAPTFVRDMYERFGDDWAKLYVGTIAYYAYSDVQDSLKVLKEMKKNVAHMPELAAAVDETMKENKKLIRSTVKAYIDEFDEIVESKSTQPGGDE